MKITSSLLVFLLVFVMAFSSVNLAGQSADTAHVAKVKAEVRKRGAGENSKVRVTLGNGTVIKGSIRKIDESSFEVSGGVSGGLAARTSSISFAEVQSIQGAGLSTGAKVAIVAVVAAGVGAAAIAVGLHKAGTGLKAPI